MKPDTRLPLSPQQVDTLRALADCIIPPDDYPGAWAAGFGDFLARQFARELEPAVPMYRQGLDALDAEARARDRRPFASLDAVAQAALLSCVERGETSAQWPIDPATFFRTVVHHVNESYWADPGNGGNRGGAAWEMIGFEVRA